MGKAAEAKESVKVVLGEADSRKRRRAQSGKRSDLSPQLKDGIGWGPGFSMIENASLW